MMRLSPSRSQRSRGWKVKHVLQICVLVGVCMWLAYQVKHSQDKKRALDEGNSKISDKVEDGGTSILKLGRKDPHGNVVIIDTDSSTQSEKDENKEAEENKQEENGEERRGNGGNEIEEISRERADEKAEHGEESGDEESKEQSGDAGLSDSQEDHEGADMSSQEAREENYKADDASSAVVRDTQEIDQENEILHTHNSEEQKEKTQVEEIETGGNANVTEDASKDSHDNPLDGESQQHSDTSFMDTNDVQKESEGESLSNSTVALESAGNIEAYSDTTSSSEDQMEQQINLTVSDHNDQVEQQNSWMETTHNEQVETQGASAEDQSKVQEIRTLEEDNSNSENNSTTFEHNDHIEQQSNSTGTVSDEQVETQTISEGANAETVDPTPQNVTVDMSSAQDQNTVNETTTLTEDNSNTHNIPPDQTEKSDPTGVDGSGESQQTSSSTDENGDASAQGEVTSSSGNVVSVTEHEQDSQMDLSTLPEVERKSAEGVAAE